MWAVRAFVVKTLSGHSRHTHIHTVDTGIFPSCFDALRWGVRLGWVVWFCQWEQCCFVIVFLSPALSHTLIDSFFSYSLSHAPASFLYSAGSVLQTKWNLAHFADCSQDCWTAIKCTTASKCQYSHCRLGSGHLMMLMAEEKSRTQRMHTKKHSLSQDFVGELINKSRGMRVIVNKVV